jgi:hypothetical protein
MNQRKLNKLFSAARSQPAAQPTEQFARHVLTAIRREPRQAPIGFLFDQLTLLFPRLAWAAALVIGFSLATELYFSVNGAASLTADLVELAEQWRFAAN